MSVEMGAATCLHLIEAKSHIEAAMVGVAHLEDAESLRHQLRCIHRQLEGMHEMERIPAATRLPVVAVLKLRAWIPFPFVLVHFSRLGGTSRRAQPSRTQCTRWQFYV